jgi:hypothetical protein
MRKLTHENITLRELTTLLGLNAEHAVDYNTKASVTSATCIGARASLQRAFARRAVNFAGFGPLKVALCWPWFEMDLTDMNLQYLRQLLHGKRGYFALARILNVRKASTHLLNLQRR